MVWLGSGTKKILGKKCPGPAGWGRREPSLVPPSLPPLRCPWARPLTITTPVELLKGHMYLCKQRELLVKLSWMNTVLKTNSAALIYGERCKNRQNISFYNVFLLPYLLSISWTWRNNIDKKATAYSTGRRAKKKKWVRNCVKQLWAVTLHSFSWYHIVNYRG